jgi:hypothetical protein
MVIRGLKAIQEKTAEVANLAGSGTRYLYIGEGDSALIRFIDDNEMIQTKMHEYEDVQPTGKKYKKAYCIENLTGTPCKWCAVANLPKNVYVFLVYVYNVIHKNQNPELNTNPDAKRWDAVKQGTATFYKEDINEIRMLRIKFGKDSYLKNAVLQFVGEYGTLCDRDYKFVRNGGGKNTNYSFIPKDPSKTPAEVLDAKQDSPTLEDILIGRKAETVQKPQISVVVDEGEEGTEDIPAVKNNGNVEVAIPIATVKPVEVKRGRKPKEAVSATKEAEDLF